MPRRFATIGLTLCAAVMWGQISVAQEQKEKATPQPQKAQPKQQPQPKTQPKTPPKPQPKTQPKTQPKSAKKGSEKSPATAEKPTNTKGVTHEEAEALAKRIDAAASKGDLSALAAAIDADELLARAVTGIALNAAARKRVGSAKSTPKRFQDSFEKQLGPTGVYRFVRVVPAGDGGAPRLLFRMHTLQGLNYIEMHLQRAPNGAVRIVDQYNLITGEMFSEIMRNLMLPGLIKDGVQLTAEQQEQSRAASITAQLPPLVKAGRHAEAMALYDTLPASVKATKSAGIRKVQVARGLGEDAYAAALDEYRKRFPDDAEIELVVLEVLMGKNDFDGAVAAVDRLDKRVGGDAYLDMFRGTFAFAEGDVEAGRAMLRKLLKTDPTVKGAYGLLVTYALQAQDYAEVALLLIAGARDAGMQWPDIEQSPNFAGFVASDEYAKWKAAQASGRGASEAPAGDGLD